MFSAFKSSGGGGGSSGGGRTQHGAPHPPPSAPSSSGPNLQKQPIIDPFIAFLFAQTGGNIDFLWSAGCLRQKEHLSLKSTLHHASITAQNEALTVVKTAEETALAAERSRQPNSLGLVSNNPDDMRSEGSNNRALYDLLSKRENMEEVISTALNFVPGLPSLYSLMIKKSVSKYSKEIVGTLTNPVLHKVVKSTGTRGWQVTRDFMTKGKAAREARDEEARSGQGPGSSSTALPRGGPASKATRQRDRLLRTAIALQAAADELRALAADIVVDGEDIPDETVDEQADRILAMALNDENLQGEEVDMGNNGQEPAPSFANEKGLPPPPPRRHEVIRRGPGDDMPLPPPPIRR